MSTEITKQQGQKITAEIKEAVDAILAAHGLETSEQRSGYGAWYEFRIKAVIAATNENGVNENTPEARAYLDMGGYYGLPEGALGAEFTSRGETFKFVGISTRSPKYPILARKKSDGRQYKFTEDAARLITDALANA